MPKPDTRLVFCGTPDFAAQILQALIPDWQSQIVGVFTRPDAPVGRGQRLTPSPVRALATAAGIPTFTPDSKHGVYDQLDQLNPTVIVVVAYGMMFPKSAVSRWFCMNIHGSLLPRYRGASPIHAALLNQDPVTGITLIKMTAKMDAGDVIDTASIPIGPSDTFLSLHNRLVDLSISLTQSFLNRFPQVTLTPQDHTAATYCHKLTPDDAVLHPHLSLSEKMGRIAAFSPSPGAWLPLENGKRVKIISAKVESGRIIPIEIKPEGKGVMQYNAYCLGNPPVTI